MFILFIQFLKRKKLANGPPFNLFLMQVITVGDDFKSPDSEGMSVVADPS